MNKVLGMIIMVLMLCAVPVFAGTDEVSGYKQEGLAEFSGIGFEEDGKYQHIVEYRKGSELSRRESIALRKELSNIKDRLPEKSFFEIARFPQVPKYFAKLSDGHVYMAVGSGSTVEAAFSNLVANFK